jgi:hypothetical protein
VFPLFATSVFVLSYLSIPYVRVAVLPSPLAAVAVERAMPPIWLAKIPRLPAGSSQAMKKVFLDERNPGPAELHPLHTLKLQASVRDVYRPQLDLLMAQNQSESTQTESISAEASTVPADYWFGYECRESLISLGEMAGSALWVGEYETAALALRIRGRLVQEVYPGFDIVNWDATQAVFLERMNTIDDETFLQLEQHIPFEQWLPDLDDPVARAAWEAAIEAQLSYLARHPVQVVAGRSARVATTPATQSEVRRSDQFMAENSRNIRWIDSRNDFLSISSWGSTWLWHLEPERSRRETSQMYRLWQTYLQQGVVPNRSLDDDDWVGPWHNYDVVTAKIQQRQREVRATATLRQRLLSLRHDSTP